MNADAAAAEQKKMGDDRTLGEKIAARISELAALSDEPDRLTRPYLGPAHRRAVDRVMQWMREAGMSARLDAVGSVVGRYEANTPGAPVLLIGSHIDTVRDAGRYDGNLGVLTAISVIGWLSAASKRFPFAIEVLAFGDEEGVRFPSTLGGSRAVAGLFDAKLLDERDADGISRRQALIDFGCDPSKIAAEARSVKDTLGYLEVHIEQGPVLEQEDLPVSVVTAINGANRGMVQVAGMSGHAGTVPMNLRRDALSAAAEIMLAIERRAAAEAESVASVGLIEVPNQAVNTIPGLVDFSLDIRSPSNERRKAMIGDIDQAIAAIAAARGVEAKMSITYDAPAAPCDEGLTRMLAASIERLGVKLRAMPSGAGHDAMAFEGRIPFAMLFVRCLHGISHNPVEYAAPEDIDVAARVLVDFFMNFARQHQERASS